MRHLVVILALLTLSGCGVAETVTDPLEPKIDVSFVYVTTVP